jgi:hypothetical protein
MKLIPSSKHVRFLSAEDLAKSDLGYLRSLDIEIRYTGDSSVCRAITLDNTIIPEIIRRVNSHEDMLAALQVIVLTPGILRYLKRHDPMALGQAVTAIAKAEGKR